MKKTIVTVIAAMIAAALAVWGGYVFCTQTSIENAELYALIPVYIILLVIGVFIEEFVHEGAHFLIGAICGMGVKTPKIRLFRSSSVEVNPNGVRALKLRFLLTAGAGLFFDLLLIALGVIAFAVPSVPALFGIAMPYAVYSFIINSLPFEYDSGKTDGLVICELIANRPTAQVLLAILRIQGTVRAGKLIQELDESMFLDVPQLPEDDINFIILTQLRYEYYLAKGNDSVAYKYFMRYKDLIKYLPSEYKDGNSVDGRKARIELTEDAKEEKDEATVTIEDINAKRQRSVSSAAAENEDGEKKEEELPQVQPAVEDKKRNKRAKRK